MSRIVPHNNLTISRNPSEWLGVMGSYGGTNNGWSTSYPYTNAFANSTSTTYAEINPPSSSMTNPCTERFGFGNFSDIPENAVINSISCTIKICSSNGSGLAIATVQLYSGDVAKGSEIDFHTNTSTTPHQFTNTGSWTREELDNLELRIICKKSGNATRYVRFYGADLTITYSYDETQYEITTASQASEITISPASQYVTAGGDGTVTLTNITDITETGVEDNDIGVSNKLVNTSGTTYTYTIEEIDCDHNIIVKSVHAVYLTVLNNSSLVTSTIPASGSSTKLAQGTFQGIKIYTNEINHINIFDDNVKNNNAVFEHEILENTTALHPSSNRNGTFSTWSSASSGHNGTSNTSSRANIQAATNAVQYGDYFFDVSSIPSNATILSISCQFRIYVSRAYSSGSGVQLMSGETTKSNLNTSWISKTSTAIYSITGIEDFTRSELDNLSLRIYGKSSRSGSSIYFYGADLTIEYEYEGDAYYLYTSEVNSSKTVRIETKPTYLISVSSTTENATISSSANSVYEDESVTITVNTQDISEISVKDNNIDISSLFSGSNGIYIYTFTVTSSHTIVVSESVTGYAYIKLNNIWTSINKIYKKESNIWVEYDLSNFYIMLNSINNVIIKN